MVATREEEKNNYGLGAAPGGDESTSAEGRAKSTVSAGPEDDSFIFSLQTTSPFLYKEYTVWKHYMLRIRSF